MTTSTPDLTQEVVTGAPHVANTGQITPQDTRRSTLRANPLEEYVAASGRNWAVNYLQSLNFAVDDVTSDFGDDLYDRMMLDSQVSACVHFFKMAVLSDPLQVMPAADAYTQDDAGARIENPDYKQAKELSEFVRRCMDRLPDLHGTLYDLLDGAPFGNRVAELIFEVVTEQRQRRVMLKAVKPKPRRSLAFVVDVYNNLAGMLALIPGQFAPSLLQSIIDTPEKIANLLPRTKFCVLTFRPRSGDPRGQSMLRPAYDAWFVKQQIKQERLKFLAQLAGGSVVGFTAESAQQMQTADAFGDPAYDALGLPVMVNPETAMLNALLQWQNGTAAAFPFGSKVEVNYPHPDSPFDAALDRQDREIATAILGSTRMVMEAEHGSRADSQTGQDVFGLLVRYGKQAVQTMLVNDVFRTLVEMNFGADALRLCPRASLTQTEHQDFAANATAVAALYKSGYLAPSQFKDADAMLGLPIRTEETDNRVDMAKLAQAGKPGAEDAPPPGGDSGTPKPADGAKVDANAND